MRLVIKDIKYHREKDAAVDIDEAQALLLVGDMISQTLAQSGFSAVIEAEK